MKNTAYIFLTLFTWQSACADLWISNFEVAAGNIASGVWKNDTTGVDTTIPVSLVQAGAVFDELTVVDDSLEWADLAIPVFPFFFNLFEPNYFGDFISLEVKGGDTAFVTINFNAEVVDPVVNFTDVDLQTTLVFVQTPSLIPGVGAPNLSVSGNNVSPDGTPLLDGSFETLGSIQFTGTFTQLDFMIVNVGLDPDNDDDRTGFSVSTETEPVPVVPDLTGKLEISYTTGGLIHLSWPDVNTFTRIECFGADDALNWMVVPGVDPTSQTSATLPPNMAISGVYFRGVYEW